jgi:D-alanine-D-alanine ligase
MKQKQRVGILFGGKSAEHEVSLQSAVSVVDAIDRDRYEVVLIGIDRQGRWFIDQKARELLPGVPSIGGEEVALLSRDGSSSLVAIDTRDSLGEVDVVFPVLHGPYGEDGSVQGLLKLAGVPFVGAGILGSAVGMDKDVMKRLLRDAGIPIAAFTVLNPGSDIAASCARAVKDLGLPLFVKPANMGSSVGVCKAHDAKEVEEAVNVAFRYDSKVIVEEYVEGREIECSVLGNRNPIASVPGEIRPLEEFYSYSAKYLDENGAELIIPADLGSSQIERIRQISLDSFVALCCSGMARVDMFLTPDDRLVVNEINTIPGFTKISMYPKLWEASGIGFTELISKLIELSVDRHREESSLMDSLE